MANPVDPVCGMELTPGQVEAQDRYKGKAYYFCSEECRQTFMEDPEAFVGRDASQNEPPPTPR